METDILALRFRGPLGLEIRNTSALIRSVDGLIYIQVPHFNAYSKGKSRTSKHINKHEHYGVPFFRDVSKAQQT